MQQEIEATFIDADHTALRSRLAELGGSRLQPEFLMRRSTYDYPDLRLDSQASWVRVRQEFDRITVGFKQRQSTTIDGMREVEFTAGDYDSACAFLCAIGLQKKAYQETKRELWRVGGCEVMLDTWPWIPPYVEIEGSSKEAVKALAEKLGFDWTTALFDSADAVYMQYYGVARTEICTVDLTFGPVPDWLEAKRIPVRGSTL